MTTLLDKQRSGTSNVQGPDEDTLDQVLLRIAALAPVVARHTRDIEQGRRLPAELVSVSSRHGFTACSCPGVTAALDLTRRAPFERSRP
jgi:hypothetical protein